MKSQQQASGARRGFEIFIEASMVSIVFSAMAYGIWSLNQVPVFSII